MRPRSIVTRGLLPAFVLGCCFALPAAPSILVRHGAALNGTVDGSLQVLSGETVSLNGGALVTGDLLVPGTPAVRLNGHPDYQGTLDGAGGATPANYQIVLNGSASLRHVVRRTDPVALPVVNVPPAPAGARNVSVNAPGDRVGDFATVRHLTLNGGAGAVAVPPGTYGDFTANGGGFILGVAGSPQPAVYHLQHLMLNGRTRLEIVGPVELTVNGGVTFNGQAGNADHPAWLNLKIATGGVTLNGGSALYAQVAAPNGAVIINGNSRLTGTLACDRLTLNGNGLLTLITANQPPVIALTAPAAGAVFTAPAAIPLAASVTDAGGAVSKVEFFANAAKVGEAAAPPYDSN